MMRKRILILTPSVLAVIVFAFTSLAQGVEGNGKKNEITWQTFDKGVELAKKRKKDDGFRYLYRLVPLV